jgi:hypothetical protein
MVGENLTVELTMAELREVAGYAVGCAEPALGIFERDRAVDPRPRAALDEARRFAAGGRRTQALRVTALDAHRAAKAAGELKYVAAADAARAAGHAGAAAYLHPLAKPPRSCTSSGRPPTRLGRSSSMPETTAVPAPATSRRQENSPAPSW